MWFWAAAVAVFLLLLQRAYGHTTPYQPTPPSGSTEPDPTDTIEVLARAIARAEGFYVAGSLPQRNHNPGALTSGGQVLAFASDADGWDALRRQLHRIFAGQSLWYSPEMTIEEMAQVWTGGDRSADWARIVAGELGVTPNYTLAEV